MEFEQGAQIQQVKGPLQLCLAFRRHVGLLATSSLPRWLDRGLMLLLSMAFLLRTLFPCLSWLRKKPASSDKPPSSLTEPLNEGAGQSHGGCGLAGALQEATPHLVCGRAIAYHSTDAAEVEAPLSASASAAPAAEEQGGKVSCKAGLLLLLLVLHGAYASARLSGACTLQAPPPKS